MAEIATLGPRAAIDLLFSITGVDGGRIIAFQNRNGLTPQQIIASAGAAIGAANEWVLSRWGNVTYQTTEQFARYRQGNGTARKTPRKVEFAPADGVRSDEIGHMLRVWNYQDALNWTMLYLRDAYQSQIDADLQLISESWRYAAESDILTRIFLMTEYAEGSGYDVPWAIGTGTNVNYIPPAYQGTTFSSSHTHFQYVNGTSASNLKTLANNMVKELRHHGITGRLVMLVSEADVESWAGVDGFVKLQPTDIQIVSTVANSNVQVLSAETSGIAGEPFGFLNTSRGVVELRYLERIPTGYCWMTRSYGNNNPQNGVAIRLHPTLPFGLRPNVKITSTLTPEIDGIQLDGTHGIGVNNRLNGVAGYFAGGASAYVDPLF